MFKKANNNKFLVNYYFIFYKKFLINHKETSPMYYRQTPMFSTGDESTITAFCHNLINTTAFKNVHYLETLFFPEFPVSMGVNFSIDDFIHDLLLFNHAPHVDLVEQLIADNLLNAQQNENGEFTYSINFHMLDPNQTLANESSMYFLALQPNGRIEFFSELIIYQFLNVEFFKKINNGYLISDVVDLFSFENNLIEYSKEKVKPRKGSARAIKTLLKDNPILEPFLPKKETKPKKEKVEKPKPASKPKEKTKLEAMEEQAEQKRDNKQTRREIKKERQAKIQFSIDVKNEELDRARETKAATVLEWDKYIKEIKEGVRILKQTKSDIKL